MIYTNLKGGLGNMLFQIAATKSFSIDYNVGFCFTNFDDQLNYLNRDNLYNPSLKHANEYRLIFPVFCTDRPNHGVQIINFPFEYHDIKLPQNDVYIDGFFQSEKFFKHNRQHILEMFETPSFIKEIIDGKYPFIKNKRTSSLHIRRGDYVKHEQFHPLQSLEYYNNAIQILKEKTDLFVVFSDDIPWCKENLNIDNIVYIENEKDYIELYLMSMCDNNVIANSSFSWWGAWLNKNENKIVIGPKKWFGPQIKSDPKDIIPDNWIKL
jgi:hypothetical protein